MPQLATRMSIVDSEKVEVIARNAKSEFSALAQCWLEFEVSHPNVLDGGGAEGSAVSARGTGGGRTRVTATVQGVTRVTSLVTLVVVRVGRRLVTQLTRPTTVHHSHVLEQLPPGGGGGGDRRFTTFAVRTPESTQVVVGDEVLVQVNCSSVTHRTQRTAQVRLG